MKTLEKQVYEVVRAIPRGKVRSYKEIGQILGTKAWRRIGSILKKNYDPNIPCHRVIHSDGRVGKYNRGEEEKIRKLREEGIIIENKKIKEKK